MADDKLPAIQFYPADWRKDASVQVLDLEHKGAWIELLFVMHESPERGRLVLPNGAPIPDPAIAKLLGIDEQKWKQMRKQLLDMGTASEDDGGVLYNRRMARDQELRRKRAEAGRLGGSRPRRKQNGSKNGSKTEANRGSSARRRAGASSSASALTATTDTSLRSVSAKVVPAGEAAPESNGSVNGHVTANQLLLAWLERQPARPPETVIRRQAGVAKRLTGNADREQLARAWIGIERIFPYDRGEPWDLFDLEKNFAKAMAKAEDEPELRRSRRMEELMAQLEEAG